MAAASTVTLQFQFIDKVINGISSEAEKQEAREVKELINSIASKHSLPFEAFEEKARVIRFATQYLNPFHLEQAPYVFHDDFNGELMAAPTGHFCEDDDGLPEVHTLDASTREDSDPCPISGQCLANALGKLLLDKPQSDFILQGRIYGFVLERMNVIPNPDAQNEGDLYQMHVDSPYRDPATPLTPFTLPVAIEHRTPSPSIYYGLATSL